MGRSNYIPPKKGQLASAESAPTVLSTEQEIILQQAADGAFSSEQHLNLIEDAYKAQGTAVSGMKAVLIGTEDGSGNLDALKSSGGELYIRSSSTLPVSDGGGSLTVDGTVGITGTVTVGTLPAGTNNIGDVDVLSIAAGTNYIGKVRLTDGTTDGEVVPLAG